MPGRITDYGLLTGSTAAPGDLVEVVDVSDTSMAATGTNKRLVLGELNKYLGGGMFHTHGVIVPHTGYIPGVIYPFNVGPVPANGQVYGGNNALNHPAGSIFYVPTVFAFDTTITQMGFNLAGGPSKDCRVWFALYNDNGAYRPGARVARAELVMPNGSGGGQKFVAIGNAPVVGGRLYWAGMNPDFNQNGGAEWWNVVNSMYPIYDVMTVLRSGNTYIEPADPAPASNPDSGWGAPLLLFKV